MFVHVATTMPTNFLKRTKYANTLKKFNNDVDDLENIDVNFNDEAKPLSFLVGKRNLEIILPKGYCYSII